MTPPTAPWRVWVALLGGLYLWLVSPLAAATQPPDPDAVGLTLAQRFDALIARASYERSRLRTLVAAFLQTKKNPLLLEPETSRGAFIYRAPHDIRWEFATPSDMVVLIDERRMLTWYRQLGHVERIRLGRQSNHILRFMGASSSVKALKKYFSLTATFPADPGLPYRLRLDPISPRIKKRIQSMTLHLHRELFVPIFLRYVEPGGATTEIHFENLQINTEIPDHHFQLELPDEGLQ